MNKILFLLGMVFCLNAQAGVAIVSGDNSAQSSGISSGMEGNDEIRRARVIKVEPKYRTLSTRGQCRAYDGSGRQVCEPGEIYEHTFIGYEITYEYKNYIGTYFTEEHPGAFVYLKTFVAPQ